MATRLLVGNLSFNTGRASLQSLFDAVGAVAEISMPGNRDTGQTLGYAYVWMATAEGAAAAIAALNGKMVDGRAIKVSAAPARDRPGPALRRGR